MSYVYYRKLSGNSQELRGNFQRKFAGLAESLPAKVQWFRSSGSRFNDNVSLTTLYHCLSFLASIIFRRRKIGIHMYIFRASITLRDGSKIYARDYNKRAFKIYIGEKDKKKSK